MYDYARPLLWDGNLHAGAIGVENAQNQKFYDVTDPWETTAGNLPLVARLPYAERVQPSTMVYRAQNRLMVAIAGIQGGADSLAVYQGYRNLVSIPGHPGRVNEFAKTWWEFFQPIMPEINRQEVNDICIFGHSWGSAVAVILSNYLMRFRTNWTVRVATYGAPRFCDAAYLEGCSMHEYARVHNHGDIVPYIMPSFTEAPFFHSLHSPGDILQFNSLRHMDHGVRIRRGHNPVMENAPSGYAYPLDMSGTTIRDAMGNQLAPHLTTEYMHILAQFATSTNPETHTPTGIVRPRLAEDGVTLVGDDAEAIAAWPHQADWPVAPQQGNVPGIPVPPPVPEPVPDAVNGGLGIHLRKIGLIWYVVALEEIVYKGVNRRDARAFARGLRSLATQYRQNPKSVTDKGELLLAIAGQD